MFAAQQNKAKNKRSSFSKNPGTNSLYFCAPAADKNSKVNKKQFQINFKKLLMYQERICPF